MNSINRKNKLFRTLSLIPGWHTNRKLVIIESDDWGSIRTINKRNLQLLSAEFPHIMDDFYTRFDSLESNEDLEALFEVLYSVRDKNGNPAVITANTIMANPDFRKIEESGFQTYFYEPFTETLKKYKGGEVVFQMYQQGMDAKLFKPQLHGREHLNIRQWLSALQNGHSELKAAFNQEMFGIRLKQKINMRNNMMAALDFDNEAELKSQEIIINEGQKLFEQTFGFKSETFIAPSYIWHPNLEPAIFNTGIKAMQGLPYQYIPNPGGDSYRKKFRYTGERTKSGLIHLVRNGFFEPLLSPGIDSVSDCMKRIELAFRMKKPAIVGSHRLNFIGGLEISNRENNLRLLKKLLMEITKKWPDVEFMSSDQLVDLIKADSNNK